MNKIVRSYLKLEEGIAQILLVIIVVLVFIAAVARTVGNPMPWSVEIAQLLFPWFAFLAASHAWRENSHVGVDILYRYFPKKVKKVVDLILLVVILGFLVLLTVYGIELSITNWSRLIGAVQISYSFITISVVYGSFSMLLTTLVKIYRGCEALRNNSAIESKAA